MSQFSGDSGEDHTGNHDVDWTSDRPCKSHDVWNEWLNGDVSWTTALSNADNDFSEDDEICTIKTLNSSDAGRQVTSPVDNTSGKYAASASYVYSLNVNAEQQVAKIKFKTFDLEPRASPEDMEEGGFWGTPKSQAAARGKRSREVRNG